jgi:hypothetical protein
MQVTIQVDISNQFIDDLIDTAGMSIGYWASEATQDDEQETYTVTEQESGDEFVITYRRIAKSLEDLIAGKGKIAKEILSNLRTAVMEDDASYVDSEVADSVIQYAIFGEIVYS